MKKNFNFDIVDNHFFAKSTLQYLKLASNYDVDIKLTQIYEQFSQLCFKNSWHVVEKKNQLFFEYLKNANSSYAKSYTFAQKLFLKNKLKNIDYKKCNIICKQTKTNYRLALKEKIINDYSKSNNYDLFEYTDDQIEQFEISIKNSIQKNENFEIIKTYMFINDLINYIDQEHQLLCKISTGFNDFDLITNGGLSRKSLTLITSESAGGKSSFLTHLCSNALYEKHHNQYKDLNILYFTGDENKNYIKKSIMNEISNKPKSYDFSEKELETFIKNYGKDLSRISIIDEEVINKKEILFLDFLENELKNKKADLVIIDNLSFYIHKNYSNFLDSSLFSLAKLNRKIITQLQKMAYDYNIGICVSLTLSSKSLMGEQFDLCFNVENKNQISLYKNRFGSKTIKNIDLFNLYKHK